MEETKQILLTLNEISSNINGEQLSAISIALIAALAAIGGSFVTALFQYLNSKRTSESELEKLKIQLKAEIISKQRQEWMDSVRESATNLLAEYDHVFGLIQDKNDNQEKINELHLSTSRNAIFIELKLNPNKPEQKAVTDSIASMSNLFHRITLKTEENPSDSYDRLRKQYISALNTLFDETWRTIKNLE